MKSLTIQLEMVPFPDPGAPTISAQILPLPPAAVDEFLLDEATEEGDPHQKAAPHMGGRRTKVDSIAKIRKRLRERKDLLKRNNERRQFHFLTAFFPCGIHFARFHLPEFVECVVDSSQVVRNTPAQREELGAAQTLKAVERHFRLSSREAKNYTPFPNYYAAFAPFTLACIVAFIIYLEWEDKREHLQWTSRINEVKD